MLRSIQRFFETRISPVSGVTSKEVTESTTQLATAALFIEITRADNKIKEEERNMVALAVRKAFNLLPEETAELISMAEEEVKEAVSIYQFTRLIDKGFSYKQKKHIVELLWHVVFADEEMEKHEEHLVRRIANLLHVSHRDFIDAKLKAREACRQDG
jgi:uncharacterized tellurite resistance protein B-like protein